ncbi:hypothetical protein G6F62_014433 [Rhizopus arrhizus]|nr:hypothetical protein G6F23_014468 [Rhizopus arrhizus]KAG0743063.1 hypothetical protein G6F24_016349 [Rhizopus arrhizus]KAG0774600.1 hypothetical protein G6F21_014122 [Rhizopus arrhizus]KAG0779744.1 hypothetical protein G6F22_010467 [Rhizopus arrhizus]KAG0809785.1 hypothetical protein G6F18_013670 [Rhizopus arrhizus]
MVSLNVDWFQPSDGMHYSCGGVYLTINNLPRSSRMKTSNIILVGMIPGPGEPTDDQIQNFGVCKRYDARGFRTGYLSYIRANHGNRCARSFRIEWYNFNDRRT